MSESIEEELLELAKKQALKLLVETAINFSNNPQYHFEGYTAYTLKQSVTSIDKRNRGLGPFIPSALEQIEAEGLIESKINKKGGRFLKATALGIKTQSYIDLHISYGEALELAKKDILKPESEQMAFVPIKEESRLFPNSLKSWER